MPFLTGAGTRITRNVTSVLARKRRKMCQDILRISHNKSKTIATIKSKKSGKRKITEKALKS